MASLPGLFGGCMAGLVIDAALFGVVTPLIAKYYKQFPKDNLSIKFRIGVLWILQASQLCFMASALYHYLVTNFSNQPEDAARRFSTLLWSFGVYQPIAVVISSIVQCFFTQRAHQLSGSVVLAIVIYGSVFIQFALGVATTVEVYRAPLFLEFKARYTKLTIIWLASEAMTDLLISVSMVVLLNRKRTGFRSTDTIINRLMLYSMGTGTITSVYAIVILAAWVPASFIFLSNLLAVSYSNTYILSMLANLHLRSHLAPLGNGGGSGTEIFSGYFAFPNLLGKRNSSVSDV